MTLKKANLLVDSVKMLLVIVVALALVTGIVLAVSSDPANALYNFFVGPFLSLRRIGNIIEGACPLVFTALAVLLIFRAGQFSMISEGAFFIGAAIGAAVIWFLVAPAVNQSTSERLNSQMRDYSDQIQSLEAQVSAQTRTLDNYRASGETLEADANQAQTARDSYENLMTVSDQYDSGEYSDAAMADTLIAVNRDALGGSGQALYDELASEIFPNACERNFNSGTEALEAADYQTAIDALGKVVQMDAGYNDGEALYELGRAYWNSGDAASATTYFQRIVDEYGESDHAQDAQAALDEIAAAAPEEDTAGEEQ